MGRTYKRNDLHNSRRPKSIREKRQTSGSKRQKDYDNFSSEDYTQRTPKVDNNTDYE